MIRTNRPNPQPDEWTENEWQRQRCRRKAMSFKEKQKQRGRERNRKGLVSNLHMTATVPQLTQLFYQWCANDAICGFCQEGFSCLEEITVDHVIPVHQGGTNLCDNLRPAHESCNSHDGQQYHSAYQRVET